MSAASSQHLQPSGHGSRVATLTPNGEPGRFHPRSASLAPAPIVAFPSETKIPDPRWYGRNMAAAAPRIVKQCAGCTHYFQADLDGEYRCPSCRDEGASQPRQLSLLDGLKAPMAL